jgi:hypothetical protein
MLIYRSFRTDEITIGTGTGFRRGTLSPPWKQPDSSVGKPATLDTVEVVVGIQMRKQLAFPGGRPSSVFKLKPDSFLDSNALTVVDKPATLPERCCAFRFQGRPQKSMGPTSILSMRERA